MMFVQLEIMCAHNFLYERSAGVSRNSIKKRTIQMYARFYMYNFVQHITTLRIKHHTKKTNRSNLTVRHTHSNVIGNLMFLLLTSRIFFLFHVFVLRRTI